METATRQTIKTTVRFVSREERSFYVTPVPEHITWCVWIQNWRKPQKANGAAPTAWANSFLRYIKHTHAKQYILVYSRPQNLCYLNWQCNASSLRKKKAFSGRPKMTRRRKTRSQVRRKMTTWSSAECVRMEESCCAVIPALPLTTSTVSTHLFLKFPMESGCVHDAWWETNAWISSGQCSFKAIIFSETNRSLSSSWI